MFHILSWYLLNDESVKRINKKHDNINLMMALTTMYRLLLLSAYDNLWVWIYLCMSCKPLRWGHFDGLVPENSTPLLTHWSYVFLALTHRFVWYVFRGNGQLAYHICCIKQYIRLYSDIISTKMYCGTTFLGCSWIFVCTFSFHLHKINVIDNKWHHSGICTTKLSLWLMHWYWW